MSEVINRFVPEVTYDSIDGNDTKRELDILMTGSKGETFYPKGKKYVQLQREVFVVQSVIGKIAKTVSRVKFTSENKNDAIVKKLENPNLKQSKQEFLKEFTIFVLSAGFMAMWIRYVSYGNFETMELINLDPDKTDIDDKGNIVAEHEGKVYTIAKEDYIIFYDTVKEKNEKGISRLKPLRSQIENSLNAQIAKGIQIEKTGVTILSPKATSAANQHDEGLNTPVMPTMQIQGADGKSQNIQTQAELLEERFGEKGVGNRVIVSGKGLDAIPLSAGLNNVKFDEITESDNLSIYDAYSVPRELSPYGKNPTYENKQVAKVQVVEEEAEPLTENLVNSLISVFPTKGSPASDYSHLTCMSYVRERTAKSNTLDVDMYVKLKGEGWITDALAIQMLKTKNIIPTK